MVGKVTSETRFGQLMICLRESKLNFVVKETPYSAELTIRKKFLKNVSENAFENENVENIEYKFKQVEHDNSLLRNKVNILEKECGLVKFELEGLDVKFKALVDEKEMLEDKLEDSYSESRELHKSNEKVFIQLKSEKESLSKQLENFKRVEAKKLQEKCDLIDTLENALANRKAENERLKEELEKASDKLGMEDQDSASNIDSTSKINAMSCKECDEMFKSESDLKAHLRIYHVFKETATVIKCVACDQCEYKDDDKLNLKQHMKEYHEVQCDECNETFAGLRKLKNHMCRVNLKDPEYLDLYLKNWYRRGDCVPVFSKRLEKELLILHSEKCWVNKNFCSELPKDVDISQKSILDEHEIIHTEAKRRNGVFRKHDSICWLEIVSLLQTHLPNYRTL